MRDQVSESTGLPNGQAEDLDSRSPATPHGARSPEETRRMGWA